MTRPAATDPPTQMEAFFRRALPMNKAEYAVAFADLPPRRTADDVIAALERYWSGECGGASARAAATVSNTVAEKAPETPVPPPSGEDLTMAAIWALVRPDFTATARSACSNASTSGWARRFVSSCACAVLSFIRASIDSLRGRHDGARHP